MPRAFEGEPQPAAQRRRQGGIHATTLARGLTQDALAEAAGINVSQVRRYEGGSSQPSLEVLRKLAVALGVSAVQLLFDETERGPDEELRLQFEAASRLAPHEKDLVREVVESMIIRHDANRWFKNERPADARHPHFVNFASPGTDAAQTSG
jgi:transcriptional regulator with XRE-family HTH domain